MEKTYNGHTVEDLQNIFMKAYFASMKNRYGADTKAGVKAVAEAITKKP